MEMRPLEREMQNMRNQYASEWNPEEMERERGSRALRGSNRPVSQDQTWKASSGPQWGGRAPQSRVTCR